ncbi:MAG: hypothetical protein JST70_11325 [Bacteroidetes bacterium]|nr:hypothetical protein [Bacteroidota bacterium]
MHKRLLLAALLICAFQGHSQAVSKDKWWEVLHNWNGYTPWAEYMQLTAKYMGPNGAPVPEMNKGMIPQYSFFEAGYASHYSTGDHTQNAFMNGTIKVGNRAAINMYFVPWEHYEMDTITSRYVRNTRDFDGKGHAVGDVYVNAYFEILKEKKHRPSLMLCAGTKTASGDNLEAARYMDAPGYYFSLSTGKTVQFPHLYFKNVRFYALAGFYSWQTYREDYRQDDAPLYGAGLELSGKHLILDDNISGYTGYFKTGDQPIVNKLSVTSKMKTIINFKVLYQYGLRDWDYASIMVSSIIDFSKVKIKTRKREITFQ